MGKERGHGGIPGASDSGFDIGAHWSVKSLSPTIFVRKWPRLNFLRTDFTFLRKFQSI